MTQTTYLDQRVNGRFLTNPCQWNDYLENNREYLTLWIATLNNGETAYQDDREGSGWLKLKSYCQANGLYIVNFRITFRNCHHHLSSGESGYYFINSAGILYGTNKTFLYYVVGVVREGKIHIERIKIPELMVEETEIRPIIGNEECLIMRPSNLQS